MLEVAFYAALTLFFAIVLSPDGAAALPSRPAGLLRGPLEDEPLARHNG
ncbi:MAG TPA: hypothetical protein VH063_15900 [Gaiellaceae bacterium]|nr:hypothetical protein [Gaiellaceae bacterium]